MPAPKLKIPYLINGLYDPTKKTIPNYGISLITNQQFIISTHKNDSTIMGTNDYGQIVSYGQKLEIQDPKQHFSTLPFELNLLPSDIVPKAFFYKKNKWQEELVKQVNAIHLDKKIKTIPVEFQKRNLKKQKEGENNLKSNYGFFKDGVIYCGQLIPKIQSIIFLISKNYLKILDVNQSSSDKLNPNEKHGAIGSTVGSKIKCTISGKPIELHYSGIQNLKTRSSPIQNHTESEASSAKDDYHVFLISSAFELLPTGSCRIHFPAELLDPKYFPPNNPFSKSGLDFRVEIDFGIHSLTGDFDFHLLNPNTLEQSILLHFGDSYAHIMPFANDESNEALKADSKGQIQKSSFAAAKENLTLWKKRFEWSANKRNLVLGIEKGENQKTIISLVNLGQEYYAHFQGKNKEIDDHIDALIAIHKTIGTLKEGKEQWETLRRSLKYREHLKKISVDSSLIKKIFIDTPWQKKILKEIALLEKDGKADVGKIAIEIFKIDGPDPKILKNLVAIEVSEEAAKIEKVFLGKGLNAIEKGAIGLNTVVSAYSLYATLNEIHENKGEYEVLKNKFLNALENYVSKFSIGFNSEAMNGLEASRKLADLSSDKIDEEVKEAVLQSIEFTLNVAMLLPEVGEFAGLALFAIEGSQSIYKSMTEAGSYLDQKYGNYFFSKYGGHLARVNDFKKQYWTQIERIGFNSQSDFHDSLGPQYRMRIMVLIGLLSLIERCGSRFSDPSKFAEKVKEYDIEGYIQEYVFNPHAKIPIYSGLTLDGIWLYCVWEKIPGRKIVYFSASHRLEYGRFFSLNFQKYFPIHTRECLKGVDLAKTFSLNFESVVAENLVFSMVYYREFGTDKWISVENSEKLLSVTNEIRVVAIFKNKTDLSGLPITFQTTRTDTFLPYAGPVYKTALNRYYPSFENKGNDGGLLNYGGEEHYHGEGYYVASIHPFYFFGTTLFKGIKPIGSIGLKHYPTMQIKFSISYGKASKDLSFNKDHKTNFKVNLFIQNQIHLQMLFDSKFLSARADKPTYRPVFQQAFQPSLTGVLLKLNGQWEYFPADYFKSGHKQLHGQRFQTNGTWTEYDFDFAWGKEFEIIIICQSYPYAIEWRESEASSFPVSITMSELSSLGNLSDKIPGALRRGHIGPAYPAEFHFLSKTEVFNSQNDPILSRFESVFQKNGMLAPNEILPFKSLQMETNGYLFAARLDFRFTIEKANDESETIKGIKPFGKEHIQPGKGEYKYVLSLGSVEPLGMNLDHILEFTLPGVPDDYLRNAGVTNIGKFITNEKTWDKVSIGKEDFE